MKIDPKRETILVKVTHSANFYKSGQRYRVYKDTKWGCFQVVAKELTLIDINHAKQIPK